MGQGRGRVRAVRWTALVSVAALACLAAGPAAAVNGTSGSSPCVFSPSVLNAAAGANVTQGSDGPGTGLVSVSYGSPARPTYEYLSFWCGYVVGQRTLEIEVDRDFPKSLYPTNLQHDQQSARQFALVPSLKADNGFVYVDAHKTDRGSAYVRNERVLLNCGHASYSLSTIRNLLVAIVDHLAR
jgi:hypothetical protein